MRYLSMALWLAILLMGGCTLLPSRGAPTLVRYSLQLADQHSAVVTARRGSVIVPRPGIRAELATDGMAYRLADYRFGDFVDSRWADSPQAMLHALLIEGLSQQGPFDHVLRPGTLVNPDYRLDIEILDFAQDFTVKPSRYRVKVQLQLVDLRSHHVVVEKLLEVSEPTPEDTARGGAIAANRAVNRLIGDIRSLLIGALGE
jgi:cholesterol transport system auxiliary component